jgi:proton-coupled amino acid transporter
VLVTYPLQLFPCLELMLTKPTENSASGARFHGSRPVMTQGDGPNAIQSIQECSATVQTPVPRPPANVFEIQRAALSDTPHDSYHDDALLEGTSWEAGGDDLASTCWTRIGLVVLTYIVAVAVPNVQSLISLAGALAGSSTALLIPPTLELAWLHQLETYRGGESLEAAPTSTAAPNRWKAGKCYVLLIGGSVFMIIGTVASIAEVFRDYSTRS